MGLQLTLDSLLRRFSKRPPPVLVTPAPENAVVAVEACPVVGPTPFDLERTGDRDTAELLRVFEQLNAQWFLNSVQVQVRWGRASSRRSGRRRQRSIRLGSYVFEDRVIRMHPVLKNAWVPDFFVAYVLFHEMLHVAEPPIRSKGRILYHHAQFKSRERAYPDYKRARVWERQNIERLLGGW